MVGKYFAGVLALIVSVQSVSLPSFFNVCHESDPELTKCATSAANKALPELVKGIPSLKVPVLSPLVIPEVRISLSQLTLILTDLNIHNLEKAIIDSVNIDTINHKISVKLTVPLLEAKATYDADGHLLILQFKGKGLGEITFKNMKIDYNLDYKLIDKNGEKHIEPTESKLSYKAENVFYNFQNLFAGDQKLGEETNKFLNENWQDVDNEVKEAIAESVKQVITNIMANVFKLVPHKEFLKP